MRHNVILLAVNIKYAFKWGETKKVNFHTTLLDLQSAKGGQYLAHFDGLE